jgi:hypothetical protein
MEDEIDGDGEGKCRIGDTENQEFKERQTKKSCELRNK